MVIGLRYFSTLNTWIDCLVLVRDEDRERATRAIEAGVDEFWNDEDLCYGDCIECALREAGIPYVAEYVEQDEDGESIDEPWEARLQQYESIGINIEILRAGGLYAQFGE